jgi:hypothetical protein
MAGESARLAADALLPACASVIGACSEAPLPARAHASSCAITDARRTGVAAVARGRGGREGALHAAHVRGLADRIRAHGKPDVRARAG